MKKIALEVLGILPTPVHDDVFALLLHEKSGERQLSMAMGKAEAQEIALAVEGKQSKYPNPYSLLRDTLTYMDCKVEEVLIASLQDKVFYAKLRLNNGTKTVTLDARPSDCIAIALRFGATLWIGESLLKEVCLPKEATEQVSGMLAALKKRGTSVFNVQENEALKYSLNELNQALQEAIREEDYELAALLRDEIDARKID